MTVNVTGYKRLLEVSHELLKMKKPVSILVCGLDGVGKNQVAEEWGQAKFGTTQVRIIKPGQGDSAGDLLGLPMRTKVYPCPFCHNEGKNANDRFTAQELDTHAHVQHQKSSSDVQLAMPPYARLTSERTSYALGDFLPTSGEGILILDELNRGGANMEAAMLELVRERKLSMANYSVPTGWMVIGLINPPSGQFIGTRDMDAAMESRFVIVNFSPTPEDWLTWSKEQGHDERLRRWLSEMKQFIGIDASFDNPILKKLKPRPRRVAMLADFMRVMDPGEPVFQDVLQGTVGTEGALAFGKFLSTIETPVKGKDILKNYGKHKDRILKQVETNKQDLLAATIEDTLDELASDRFPPPLKDSARENLIAFLDNLPKDQTFALAKAIGNGREKTHLQKHYDLLSGDKAFKSMLMLKTAGTDIKVK